MAQQQHAQADLHGVFLVVAGDVHVRALAVSRRIRSNTAPLSSRLDSPWSPPASMALATSETGSAGTTRPTSRIRRSPSRSISAKRCSSGSARKSMPRSAR